MVPYWLEVVSIVMLGLGVLSGFILLCDVLVRPQHMWIMNVVWPIAGLYGTVFALWAYYKYGLLATKKAMREASQRGEEEPPNKRLTPFPAMVAKGSAHCGGGCTLGDLCAEWLVFLVPAVATVFGYPAVFSHRIFAVWIVDYLFAFGFGIAFQYFTIKPMRGLSVGQGILQAVKADTLSLTAWQVGMYGFMGFAYFWIFKAVLHAELQTDTPVFWFMMQIAMMTGFVTSYPVNWLLLRAGIKEKM